MNGRINTCALHNKSCGSLSYLVHFWTPAGVPTLFLLSPLIHLSFVALSTFKKRKIYAEAGSKRGEKVMNSSKLKLSFYIGNMSVRFY